MSIRTTLGDPENNIDVNVDEFGNCKLSDIIKSLQFRIQGHRKFIKRERQTIVDNVDYQNIVYDSTKNIEERMAKIDELNEMLECVFKIK